MKLFKTVECWLRNIVWEETQRASRHFKPLHTDPTADIVKLILDLHDKKWSYKSDSFLRNLNIDPTAYWEKYNKTRKP